MRKLAPDIRTPHLSRLEPERFLRRLVSDKRTGTLLTTAVVPKIFISDNIVGRYQNKILSTNTKN